MSATSSPVIPASPIWASSATSETENTSAAQDETPAESGHELAHEGYAGLRISVTVRWGAQTFEHTADMKESTTLQISITPDPQLSSEALTLKVSTSPYSNSCGGIYPLEDQDFNTAFYGTRPDGSPGFGVFGDPTERRPIPAARVVLPDNKRRLRISRPPRSTQGLKKPTPGARCYGPGVYTKHKHGTSANSSRGSAVKR